jgi:molecular chaperone GrpE
MSHEAPSTGTVSRLLVMLEGIGSGIDRLRKTVLRHGQAQELFQQRIDDKVERMTVALGSDGVEQRPRLDKAQLRALLALDNALLALVRSASTAESLRDADAPASIREGLDLLHIRVRNMQHSFGLEPILALGHPFDDRLHRAESTCYRPAIADGQVVEEILPGYRRDSQVLRPTLVVVNRHPQPPAASEQEAP